MPIINHILQSVTQPNGSISYVLRMYDQEGTEYLQTGFAPPDFDMQALVNLRIAQQDENLAEMEFNQIVGE